MKIVHINSCIPYNDYWGYQDNLLPKYHRKMGHDVTLITNELMYLDNGKIIPTECGDYTLEDGIRVIRLKRKAYSHRALTNIHARMPVGKLLDEIKPDLIFFHSLASDNIYDVVAYKKKINPDCVIVQDNHLDYYNMARPNQSVKDKMIRWYYRHINKRNIQYIDRVYGVTPWRKQYAEDYFRIPSDKTDVLIMGADDEKIDFVHRQEIRCHIRTEQGIAENDFLIVTGGKIDEAKKIHLLMEAVKDADRVKLLIFGQLRDNIKSEFHRLLSECPNVLYIGWIPSDDVYNYFFAADLVCFPGTHSVLWEQACASKVPCLFKRWEGMEHVNHGGNSDFLDEVSVESIQQKLTELLYTDKYYTMKQVAESEKTDIYLYSHIAEKSLECAKKA